MPASRPKCGDGMLAVDTNVVVRYLANDHPEQAARARELVDGSEVWLPITVVLETAWVLRSTYRRNPAEVCAALRSLVGLATVSVEHPARVAQALDWSEQGLDFADALHLAAALECDAMITFDAALINAATKAGLLSVRQP